VRSKKSHGGEEQVSLLTAGVSLPLAPIKEIHLKFFASVLANAWCYVNEQIVNLSTYSETEINTLMEATLNQLREEDQRWAMLVSSVVRGREMISFDGSDLEKRPDLSLQLTNRNPKFPLIVECKLIDVRTDKPVRLYCKDGLARFLKGEYSWFSQEAFMLAYVRDGSTVATCLTPYLHKYQRQTLDRFETTELPITTSADLNGVSLDLAGSKHKRRFRFIERSPPDDNPGPISIWHLWLAN